MFMAMDGATEFILCHGVSPIKFGYDAVPLLEEAKKKVGFVPRIFVTGSLK